MVEKILEFQRGKPGYEGYLNDKVVALSELTQDAGYHTLMSGKWHLGMTRDRWPCTRGFDRSYALLPGAANHYGWEPQLLTKDEELPRLLRQNQTFYVEDDRKIECHDLGENFYSTTAFTDKLLSYLNDWSGNDDLHEKPFFGYLAYSAPHWPLQAPEKDIKDYRGMYDDGPPGLRERRLKNLEALGLIPKGVTPHDVVAVGGRTMSKEWNKLDDEERKYSSRCMEIFAGMVQCMDTQIGRVLDRLRELDELDNTLVMFMSDNGAEGMLLESIPLIEENIFDHIATYYDNSLPNLGKYNSYAWYGPQWASASTAPGRLYKSFTSEGGIKVPLILRYPPLTAGRQGIDHSFCTVMDICPTVLELAGLEHPAPTYRSRAIVPVRGTSWVPYFKDNRKTIHSDQHVTGWELFGRQAVRKGNFKALLIPEPYGPGCWQLYDLTVDPGETDDLGRRQPEKLAELIAEWNNYVTEVGLVGDAMQYGILRAKADTEK